MGDGQAPASQPVSHFPKQAIVVVHGMGEQMPMDTIKSFVRAAWELHVHENRSNLYPAWKSTSTPREHVAGRDTYNLDGALRPLLK